MNDYNILAVWGEETNSFYDPKRANNGGGYAQPAGGMLIRLRDGREVVVEVEDTSCGEFGDRVFVEISAPGFLWRICYGDMDDCCIDSEDDVDAAVASVSGVLGTDAWSLIRTALDAADLCADESPIRRRYAEAVVNKKSLQP